MNWRMRLIGSMATVAPLRRADGFWRPVPGVRLRALPSYYAAPRVPKSRRTSAPGPNRVSCARWLCDSEPSNTGDWAGPRIRSNSCYKSVSRNLHLPPFELCEKDFELTTRGLHTTAPGILCALPLGCPALPMHGLSPCHTSHLQHDFIPDSVVNVPSNVEKFSLVQL